MSISSVLERREIIAIGSGLESINFFAFGNFLVEGNPFLRRDCTSFEVSFIFGGSVHLEEIVTADLTASVFVSKHNTFGVF